jgi:carboxypeptidase Taq
MTCARLGPVLSDLRARLVPWVGRLREVSPPPANFPEPGERARFEFSKELLRAIGFDHARGNLGYSTHPFTAQLGLGDVRLTMRQSGELAESILTVMHEGGHALYDQGFAEKDRERLLLDAPSMGMHEGQSRLWENHVGRSHAFWCWLLPQLREALGRADKGVTAEALYRHVNSIGHGTVRVRADEMSYHLHIVMRFDLERALVSGDLPVPDLKAAWDALTFELLGAKPKSDLVGVLQDSHWAGGNFGYFPTYTIGSLYAAQLAETYARDHSLEEEIASGNFASLRGWLKTNVHAVGNRFPAEDLMTRVTGKGLDTTAFFAHLASKFPD